MRRSVSLTQFSWAEKKYEVRQPPVVKQETYEARYPIQC